jgi:hypothetical protein
MQASQSIQNILDGAPVIAVNKMPEFDRVAGQKQRNFRPVSQSPMNADLMQRRRR